MATKIARVLLESVSPYSQSRQHEIPKEPKELNDTHEERTWREKGHYNADGHMVIPAMSFKNCLAEAAQYLSLQIPGKGKATYTKNFQAGVLVFEDLMG